MQAREDADYRIQVAERMVVSCGHDIASAMWPECVDHGQQAVENAAKAVLAMLGPVPATHGLSVSLRRALARGDFPAQAAAAVERLAQLSDAYGPDTHMQARYGNERDRVPPWEIFGEPAARKALDAAEEAVRLAKALLGP